MVPNWREGIPCVLCGAVPPGGLPYRGAAERDETSGEVYSQQIYLCDDCDDRVDNPDDGLDEELWDLVFARSREVNEMLDECRGSD